MAKVYIADDKKSYGVVMTRNEWLAFCMWVNYSSGMKYQDVPPEDTNLSEVNKRLQQLEPYVQNLYDAMDAAEEDCCDTHSPIFDEE